MADDYDGFTSSNFSEEDMVKVQFVWSDNNNSRLHTAALYGIIFNDSTTTVDGIGLKLKRERSISDYNNLSQCTDMILQAKSGNMTFTQCVFRNICIEPVGSDSPYPMIVMGYKEGRTGIIKEETGSANTSDVPYVLDHLNYYCLPNVFVDDPPM